MKLRSRTKHDSLSIKQEIPTIDCTLDKARTYSKDSRDIAILRAPSLFLKEDTNSSKFVGRLENNQTQTVSAFQVASQTNTNTKTNTNTNTLKNIEYVDIEVKQEVTLKPEAILHGVTGKLIMRNYQITY